MNQVPKEIPTIQQTKYKCDEESYAGPAQLQTPKQRHSPSQYFERIKRKKGSLEKDLIPEGIDIRIEEYRLGGPILVNLPACTGSLPVTSPLALMWNSGGLVNNVECIVEDHHVEWHEISAVTRSCARKVEPQVDTIFILAKNQNSNKNWLGVFRNIRILCTSLGLPNINIEIADEKALVPIFSSLVEMTEPIFTEWPILEPQIIEILGSQPWLTLELLRRGKDLNHGNNPLTVVVTIEKTSESDWTPVRDKITKLLEEAGFEYIAVEIGRGVIFNGADKDSRMLPMNAYTLEARPGTSLGRRGSTKSAGTFGCFVRLRFPDSDDWQIMGLTCHHVVLPRSSAHPKAKEWDLCGIFPSEKPNLAMVMPSRLDHVETVAFLENAISSA